MPRKIAIITFLFTCLLPSSTTLASSGDRAPIFQTCLSRCEQQTCDPSVTLPLALRLTQWTCTDECRYTCMHTITNHAVSTHDYVHQYYGKWPFWRFAGMQEPASVLFSILNLVAHIQGLSTANQVIPGNHPMRSYYLGWGIVNVNAWIWSVVFHTRDTSMTEKLDYFSAGLAILYSLFYTVVRLFHLYAPLQHHRLVISQSSTPPSPLLIPWGVMCLISYLLHVSYLALSPRFDYTYNVVANLVIGILHNLLWITYSFSSCTIRPFPLRSRGYRPKHVYQAALFAMLTTLATTLELFDFPPWWRVIDAHALWHLSTVPLVSFWWSFLISDALDEGWRTAKT